jgi:hypothetical protein
MVASLVLAGGLFLSSAVLRAEVKTEEKSQFKMEGMMGRMMGMFGGKAAKDGVVNTVAVKGNRKVTTSEYSSEIIDLSEQKIYELDLKKKSYTVKTFDEMRRQLKEQQEKMAKAAKDDKKEEQPQKQMEFDFSLKETGQKRTINGYDCREVLMTITMHEKGKTIEESGGMVITSHTWLGPDIPATKEISDFDLRYAKAMDLTFGAGGSAEQMAMATAMYPGMKEMMGKMQVESVNMKGAQILTEMTMESAMNAAQAQSTQEQKQDNSSSAGLTSVRGIGGMLGGLRKKKTTEEDSAANTAAKPKNRATLMTMTHELLKVETSVPDSAMAVPADFKLKN